MRLIPSEGTISNSRVTVTVAEQLRHQFHKALCSDRNCLESSLKYYMLLIHLRVAWTVPTGHFVFDNLLFCRHLLTLLSVSIAIGTTPLRLRLCSVVPILWHRL